MMRHSKYPASRIRDIAAFEHCPMQSQKSLLCQLLRYLRTNTVSHQMAVQIVPQLAIEFRDRLCKLRASPDGCLSRHRAPYFRSVAISRIEGFESRAASPGKRKNASIRYDT